MKSTDVILPLPMLTPIAAAGSRDDIPQAQADAQESWFCSIENGFPDITMQAVSDGGQPPRGQGVNGLFYLSSDQRVFLQNGGVITFNQDVSDAIGGYPAGAVLDLLLSGKYYKVRSLVDDNTVDFNVSGADGVNWEYLDISSGDAGEIGANNDLSNLTASGNAKFQFAPFSINSGSIDASGNNNTLSLPGGSPVSVDIQFTQPVLTANGTLGGNSFAVSASSVYTGDGRYQPWQSFGANAAQSAGGSAIYGWLAGNSGQSLTFYNPVPLKIRQIAAVSNYSPYYVQSYKVYGSNDNSTWTELPQSASGLTVTCTGSEYYTYHRITITSQSNPNAASLSKITIDAVYSETISQSSDLICAPCTITTADSRTKTFTASKTLNCASQADGAYKVLKSYQDGSLSLAPSLLIQKKDPDEISWTQPVLTADGILGGSSPAAAASGVTGNLNAYHVFDGLDASSPGWAYSASVPQWILFYNPEAFILQSFDVINRYHAWRAFKLQGSNDGSAFEDIQEYTNSDTAKDSLWTKTVNTVNQKAYKYYRFYITQAGQYVDAEQIKLYGVISKPPVNGALWLDNSMYLLQLKEYNGTSWTLNNDLVYIGDVTVSNGVITAVNNNEFNKYMSLLNPNGIFIAEKYENGASGYRLYSDGYIEQWGHIVNPNAALITFLKAFKDTNYNVTACSVHSSAANLYAPDVYNKTASSMYMHSGSSAVSIDWRACGYTA